VRGDEEADEVCLSSESGGVRRHEASGDWFRLIGSMHRMKSDAVRSRGFCGV
jgi:hypothetical protein